MDLSVIITHHRDVELLEKCLEALLDDLQGISSEIIVVCSQYKPERLKEFQDKFPDVIFFPFENNLYFVRSVNRGLEKAKGDFILVMNDDVVVSKKSIGLLLRFLRENEQVGLVGPKILYPDKNEQASCFRFYTPLTIICRRTALGKIGFCEEINKKFLYQDKNLNQEKGAEVDWLSNGAGVLTRRVCVEKVGLLDEKFRHYFSDVDWSRRFWQNGYKVVYFPKSIFYHHHGKRSGSGIVSLFRNKMARMHLWDGLKYFWKWGVKII